MTHAHGNAGNRRALRVLLITWGLASCGYGIAASNSEAYELQERCGRHAAETFKREFGTGDIRDKDGRAVWTYRNHYNAQLNKCFYLESSARFPKKKEEGITESRRLYDLHENKVYAQFSRNSMDKNSLSCSVAGTQCSSAAEWESLIKAFMEN